MDDRFIGATGSHTSIYHPVSLVVADTLLYHFNYSAVDLHFFKIVQGNDPGTVPLFKQYYQDCNAYGHFINGFFLFLFMKRIILASGSPRRKQLLEWAEVPFEIVVRETSETYPAELKVEDVAIHIARQKALAVQPTVGGDPIILAADTIVVLNERIIGKPKDRQDAINILSDLSGHQHRVITGVVIVKEKREISFFDSTDVYFHDLTAGQIEFYVDKYKPYDKAGAYAIQEWIGVVGIKSVKGDFYNVMGLPVSRVVKELEKIGS